MTKTVTITVSPVCFPTIIDPAVLPLTDAFDENSGNQNYVLPVFTTDDTLCPVTSYSGSGTGVSITGLSGR